MREITPKTNQMKLLERIYGEPIEMVLHNLYVDKGLRIDQIAEELTIAVGTVHGWLEKANIRTRKIPWNKGLRKEG